MMSKFETMDLLGSRSVNEQWCLGICLMGVIGTRNPTLGEELSLSHLMKPVPEVQPQPSSVRRRKVDICKLPRLNFIQKCGQSEV